MRKRNVPIIVTILVSLLLIGVTAAEGVFVFRMTSRLTRESGTNRLEAVSGELQETISAAKNNTMRLAVEVQPYLGDKAELDSFITQKKRDNDKDSDGVCYNTYIAGEDWFIIPDFIAGSDYIVSKRNWYVGAVRNAGEAFVTDPYIDAATGNVCYTVSVLLNDKKTVVAMDYTMDNIQQHISRMYSTSDSKAVIVTEEGIIAGCSDDSYIGKDLVQELPDYAGIFSLVKSSDGSVNISQQSDNLFAARSGFGWYLIVRENSHSLYRISYIQMFAVLIVSLVVFAVIVALYVISARTAKRTQETLDIRDDFLKRAVSELKEPLARISACASEVNYRHSSDYELDFDNIREAADTLSEKVASLRSYSDLVITKHKTEKKRREKRLSFSRSTRSIILAALIVVLGISMYVSISSTMRFGKQQMQKEVSNYEYRFSEWVNTQKSILDMFCSIFSTRPELLKDYDKSVDLLDDITKQYPEISASYIANPLFEKTSVYMNNGWIPDSDWRVEEREWYKELMASEKNWIISSPYYDEKTGLYCVTFAERVYNARTGEFIGNFGIDFYMDKLVDILGDSYSDEGYAFLADAGGEIINHPNGSYQMKESGSTNIIESDYKNVTPDGESVELMKDYDGNFKFVVAKRNSSSNFTVYVVKSFSSTYGGMLFYSLLSIVAIGFCIVLVYKLMSSLIRLQYEANRQLKQSAEAAIAADEAKSTFLAQMSHEIRTPINAVLGMNEMILRETDNASIYEYASNISSAGRTLLSLINSILDFSKIEDGKMEIIPVRYDTASMISDIVSAIAPRARAKGLELSVKADESLPRSLHGDDMRIKQVIMNLLTNAVKYTETGTVTFIIRKEDRADDTIDIYVEVTDTGIGIRQEDMTHLFESFMRLDQNRNRNIEGTGLGMSIVTKLLEMMNSKLDVTSEYGKGSTFSFVLRQQICDEEPMGDYARRAFGAGAPGDEKKHIYAPQAKLLAVDDNDMNLKVAAGLMKLYGIVPDTAGSGEEAIELIKKNKYDIVLLDHMMPKLDGVKTLEILKRQKLISDSTVVIALTANAINGAKEAYLEAGFDDYLTKPIDSRLLEGMLGKYLPQELVSFRETSRDRPQPEQESEDSFTLSELEKIHSLCPQINIFTGLEYCLGSKSFYLRTLQSFLEADKRQSLSKAFKDGDTDSYRITVHSLKSASLTIGAQLLSDHAKTHELAASQGDEKYISDNFETLMQEYEKLIADINSILSEMPTEE